MPPKKLKSIGRKKPVRRTGGTTGTPFTQRAPTRTPMTAQYIAARPREEGHGITEPYASGRPGAFQAAFNPFETPAAGRTTFNSRFNPSVRPVRLDFSQEANATVNQTVLGQPSQQMNDFTGRPEPLAPIIDDASEVDFIGYNESRSNIFPTSIRSSNINYNQAPEFGEDMSEISSIYGTPYANNAAEMVNFNEDTERLIPIYDPEYDMLINFTPSEALEHARNLDNLSRAYGANLTREERVFVDEQLGRNSYVDDGTPLLQNEIRRPGSQRYGLGPLQDAQVRLSFGGGSSAGQSEDYARERGYNQDDSVVAHTVNHGDQMLNSDGYSANQHYSPHSSSIWSDPMHTVGVFRPIAPDRGGPERPTIHHPMYVGPPVIPSGISGHSAASSEATPPIIGGSSASTATHPMYIGDGGTGAHVPAEGGYLNVNFPQQIPTLLDLAPAADLPIQTFGAPVLTSKSPANALYWNPRRNGIAVFG